MFHFSHVKSQFSVLVDLQYRLKYDDLGMSSNSYLLINLDDYNVLKTQFALEDQFA